MCDSDSADVIDLGDVPRRAMFISSASKGAQMRFPMRALLVPILMVPFAPALQVQQAPSSQSRFALTPDRLSVAMADPNGARLGLSVVAGKINRGDFRIYADKDGAPMTVSDSMTRSALTDAPFDVYVLTPYIRAAVTAADARRRYAPPPVLSPAALNADGIIVSIAPSANFLTADSVDAVVLLTDLGRRTVQPVRSAPETRTVSNALGAHKTVTVGAFYFRFEDFEQLPLAIVCVQASGRTLRLWIDEGDFPR
jgi:hypothetical protein